MLLSIIIPVYNAEKYIKNCLDSLFHQQLSEKDFEVICVNDGSADGSFKLLQEYQKLHTNICIENIPNSGQGHARNIGIELAKGKYIYFVDSDDYISYDSLHIVLNKALIDDLDMCFFAVQRVLKENLYTKASSEKSDNKEKVLTGIDYFAEKSVNNGPWHFFIKRAFIKEYGLQFVEGRYCEDGMFLIDCILQAQRCMYYNMDIYRYVKRENSTMTQKDKKHQRKIINDFLFTVEYLNRHVIDCKENKINEKFIKKLITRRNSYTFSLQSRMVKAGIKREEIGKVINRLKLLDCYPYGRLDKKEYPGFVYSFLGVIYNKKLLFILFCRIYTWVKFLIRIIKRKIVVN